MSRCSQASRLVSGIDHSSFDFNRDNKPLMLALWSSAQEWPAVKQDALSDEGNRVLSMKADVGCAHPGGVRRKVGRDSYLKPS